MILVTISDLSMFRVLKRSLNGVGFLALVLSLPSKTSGSQKVSKLWKAERSTQTTCLAKNSHLHTSLLILKNKFVLMSSIVLPSHLLTITELRRDRDSFNPSLFCQP